MGSSPLVPLKMGKSGWRKVVVFLQVGLQLQSLSWEEATPTTPKGPCTVYTEALSSSWAPRHCT